MHAFKKLTLATAISASLGAAVPVLTFTAPAMAQSDLSGRINKLEQDVQRLQKQGGIKPGSPAEINMDTTSELTQRVLVLERMVEQLTGQIEELRFNSDRNGKQMTTLQDDVSLRLARIEQSLGLAGAPPAAAPQQQGQLVPAPGDAAASAPVAQAPQALAPQAAANSAANGPPDGVNNNGGFVIRTDAQGRALPPDPNQPQTPPPAAPLPTAQQAAPKAAPGPGPVSSGQIASAGGPVTVTMPEGTPKQQYEYGFEFLKKQDYPRAESALRQFLKAHPKDPLAGNAQYWLGETYYVRGDFQQAAVEFMAGYTNYPKTNKGPDNLLKLGMAMSKLNQKDGACTALTRINKDYPDAPDTVIKQAQAERAKLKCK